MKIKYLEQDITKIDHPCVILHGVNCQGVMGSGVAKALSDKWPEVKQQYLHYPNKLLGQLDWVYVGNGQYVVNCFTQVFYGRDKKTYANPLAIGACTYLASGIARGLDLPVYMPKIGAGLGGLDWEREVVPLIESKAYREDFILNVCIPPEDV